MENEIKRDVDVIMEVADKLNKLINIYADTEGLIPYTYTLDVDCSKNLNKFDEPLSDEKIVVKVTTINITKLCKESAENNVRNFYKMLSSFVSDLELEHLLAARFFPDYLVMLNIFNSLLYSMPRDVQKSDLEYLNYLYKKYNVKF